jgi:sorbitol-specific phosphotransferase system component IIC
MDRARAIHTIVVEMTTGMLVLATLATIILAFVAFVGRERHARLADAADAVVLFGAGIGTPMILFSILSGFRQWPLEAFLHGAIVQNKIFASLMALSFWTAFLLLRLAAGKRVWAQPSSALWGLLLAVGGFTFLVFTASIGGALAQKPSGFEEIVRIFVETRRTFFLPVSASVLLIAMGVALPIIALFASKKAGKPKLGSSI